MGKNIIIFLALLLSLSANAQLRDWQTGWPPNPTSFFVLGIAQSGPKDNLGLWTNWKDIHKVDTFAIVNDSLLCISLWGDSVAARCVVIPGLSEATGGRLDTAYINAGDSLVIISIDGDTTYFQGGGDIFITTGIDTVYDYTALRNYVGDATALKVQKQGIEGLFVEYRVSAEDGGVIIEANDGRFWRRLFDPHIGYNIEWWEAVANDGINDRDTIQHVLDYVDSIGGGMVVIPEGVFNVTVNENREGLYVDNNIILSGLGWKSEIRITGDSLLSSSGILNRRSSGTFTAIEQRTLNENIHYQNFKVTFTERTDYKNIAIGLSANNSSIKNVWVDSCGGYSFLFARSNDTDTIGSSPKNIIIENIKATNFMDTGLEIWGVDGLRADGVDISGPGVSGGYGHGLYIWNGARNIVINNLRVIQDTSVYIDTLDRHLAAIGVYGFALGYDTIFGATNTRNITIKNIYAHTDMAIRINSNTADSAINYIDSLVINDGVFVGFDSTKYASDINKITRLIIQDCSFDRFAKHLQFSNTGAALEQNTVSDVEIHNCDFTWGEGIDIFGMTRFNIHNNRFYLMDQSPPIRVRGGRYGFIKHNLFFNIGVTADLHCIDLLKLNASETIETRHIEVTHNTSCDDRIEKHTDDLVVLYDATDSITIKYNVLHCADSDADPYLNLGTGLVINIEHEGNWTDTGPSLYPSENDDVHIPSILSGYTGKLNVIGRIDQRFPSSTLDNIMIGRSAGNVSMTGNLNIGIGYGALQNTTSGTPNIGIGYEALNSLTTGLQNVAIGYQALTSNNGTNNFALGTQALLLNTSGNANTAIGSEALWSNSTGFDNIGIGFRAGKFNQTGVGNVIIGNNAAASSDSQIDRNTFIGAASGFDNNGDDNVFIGYSSGSAELGDGKLYIESSNSATPLVWGDFYNDLLKINGQLGYTTEGGSAITLAGRDASEYFTNMTIGTGLSISGGALNATAVPDDDWYERGTVFPPDDNTDTIETSGIVGISETIPAYMRGQLNIGDEGTANIGLSINGFYTDVSPHRPAIAILPSGSTTTGWYHNLDDVSTYQLQFKSGSLFTPFQINQGAPTGAFEIGTDDLFFGQYPNTRDDGTPTNVLGTNATGTLQSYPVGDISGADTDDQNLTIEGTGPNYTIAIDDGTDVIIEAGTGISLSEAVANTLTINNTVSDTDTDNQNLINAADATSHTISIQDGTGTAKFQEGTGITLTTTGVPTDAVTTIATTALLSEVDGSVSNEGILGVGAGGATSSTLLSNTSTSNPVTINVAGINTISEVTSSNGGSITITGTEAQTLTGTSPSNDYLVNILGTSSSFRIIDGPGITMHSLTGTTNSTITLEANDISEVNEIQTLTASGSGSTYALDLSLSGGSVTLIEGTGITIDRTLNALTFNSTGGSSDNDWLAVDNGLPPNDINEDMYSGTGKHGFGTTTPDNAVEISTTSASGSFLSLESTNAGTGVVLGRIQFDQSANSGIGDLYCQKRATGTNDAKFVLGLKNDGGTTDDALELSYTAGLNVDNPRLSMFGALVNRNWVNIAATTVLDDSYFGVRATSSGITLTLPALTTTNSEDNGYIMVIYNNSSGDITIDPGTNSAPHIDTVNGSSANFTIPTKQSRIFICTFIDANNSQDWISFN